MIDRIDEKRAREINAANTKWIAVRDADDQFRLTRRGGKRDFTAALVNRLSNDWDTIIKSSDEVLRWNLQTLIARSRDLERNNEYASGFLLQMERNVVGERGIKLSMQIREPDMRGGFKVDEAASEAIERAWGEFSLAKNFLVTGDMTQADVQRLVMRSIARDGGVIGRKIVGPDAGNKFNFAIQLLEIDHLDTEYNDVYKGNPVRMGVEMNTFGRVVAYHLLTEHPGELSYVMNGKRYIRLPADQIIHPFQRFRIGQHRGYPWMAATMSGLKMLLGYKEAELVASRAAASIGNFFRDPDGAGNPYENNGEGSANPESITPMEPGVDKYIGSLEVVPNNPQHPVAAFGDFLSETLRGIAVGMGISHHNLSGNMSGVNYSSARIAELAERDHYRMLQRWFADVWLTPVFEAWLEMALASGQIRLATGQALPTAKFDKYNQPMWRGRRWQWVDPLKEANAAEKWHGLRALSIKQIIEENGRDEEDVYAEIARGKRLREELGIETVEAQPQQQDEQQDQQSDDSAPDMEAAMQADKMLIEVYGVGGTQALMELITKVAAGEIPRPQAKAILMDVFGMDDATAEKILPNEKDIKEPQPDSNPNPQVDNEDMTNDDE